MRGRAGRRGVSIRELFADQGVTCLDQLLQFLVLPFEALGYALFAFRPRGAGGLLDQLPDVVPKNGDAVVHLRQRQRTFITHHASPNGTATELADYFAGS